MDSGQNYPQKTKEIFLGYGGDKESVVKSYINVSFTPIRMILSLNLDTY